jgi:iron complex transport system substrate-binding protein
MLFSKKTKSHSVEFAVAALCVATVLPLLRASPASALEVIDATGAKVKVVDRPQRIVTLAPSLGELAADFCGATEVWRIAGVSEFSDFPESLAKVASIGPYARFNIEKVAALKPDLVLATLDGNAKDQVLRLRELGLPVVVVGTATLADVAGSMRLVARAIGVPDRGERMAARFSEGLAHIRHRASKRAKSGQDLSKTSPRVLLQIGDDPLVVVGGGAFLHDGLVAVGARNLYGDEKKNHYPRPALEDVVHRDPDVILVLALGRDRAPFDAMAARWSRFATLAAVKRRKIRVLQADALLRPTARLLGGLAELETAVYGDR